MKRILLLIVALLFSGLALAATNINTATKEELEALSGIGPVKAQAIIDYRNANGPFKSPEDIMKVKGIKEGEFGKIRNDIAVSGATTPIAPAKGEKAAPSKASQTPAAPAKSAEKAAPAKASEMPAAPAKSVEKAAPAKDATADKTASAKASSDKDDKAKAKEEKAAKAKADKEAKAKAKEEKAAKAKAEKDAKAKAKEEKAVKAKDKAADTSAKKEDEAAKAKK
jgi:competence protein ComEA